MGAAGFLERITAAIPSAVLHVFLVFGTAFSSVVFNVTADQYIAIVVPGRMFREAYAERGVAPQLLSRTWRIRHRPVCHSLEHLGVAQSGVGRRLAFAPYCVFNYVSPLMTYWSPDWASAFPR